MDILKIVYFIKSNGNGSKVVERILKKTSDKNLLKQIFWSGLDLSPQSKFLAMAQQGTSISNSAVTEAHGFNYSAL